MRRWSRWAGCHGKDDMGVGRNRRSAPASLVDSCLGVESLAGTWVARVGLLAPCKHCQRLPTLPAARGGSGRSLDIHGMMSVARRNSQARHPASPGAQRPVDKQVAAVLRASGLQVTVHGVVRRLGSRNELHGALAVWREVRAAAGATSAAQPPARLHHCPHHARL